MVYGLLMGEVKKWIACWAIAVSLLSGVRETFGRLAALGLKES